MALYTRFGSGISTWDRLTPLDPGARWLWVALYTSNEAKRLPPGLFHGSITTMAECARITVDAARLHLDQLLEAELVEYDMKQRVLRLCELPDCGESPANANILRGWWNKFRSLPKCAVRDAHVATLSWLMEEWARENSKVITEKHREAWSVTFGTIVVPAARRRGIRRLVDHATGTPSQPGLFDPVTAPPEPICNSSGQGSVRPLSAHSEPSVNGSDYSQASGEWGSVDNSDSMRQLSDSRYLETVSKPFRNPQDPGSRIQILSSSFPDSGAAPLEAPTRHGSSTQADHHLRHPVSPHAPATAPATPPAPEPAHAPPHAEDGAPAPAPGRCDDGRLRLVPPEGSCTPQQLVEMLAQGEIAPRSSWDALYATIAACDSRGFGPADLAMVGKLGLLARGEMAWPNIPPRERLAWWVGVPGRLVGLVEQARARQAVVEQQQAYHRDMMAQLEQQLAQSAP